MLLDQHEEMQGFAFVTMTTGTDNDGEWEDEGL